MPTQALVDRQEASRDLPNNLRQEHRLGKATLVNNILNTTPMVNMVPPASIPEPNTDPTVDHPVATHPRDHRPSKEARWFRSSKATAK